MTKGIKKPNKILVTHDGSFHSDDIFAAATLAMYLEDVGESYEIIRTRDEEVIKSADVVFDVGGVHDPKTNRFDHHQVGGAGARKDGVEYASFGLVWEKFGIKICGSEKVATFLDNKLVAPVDAWDNGFELVESKYPVSPYFIQHFFLSMRPTWKEEHITEDQMFRECVAIAKMILSREITQTQDGFSASDSVMADYERAKDKRIIVLEENYPWQHILKDFPEPLFVVYPRKKDGLWGVKAVKDDPKTFNQRMDFPTAWAGLRDEELQNITGVDDAVFCHRGLFMAVARSREGAVKLAELAITRN